jgi:hypothetical protein
VRVSNVLCSGILALAIVSPASAEIYESKDAQGNTVFSDKPSPGAQEIAVPPTNSADPVVESPRPPPRQKAPVSQRTPASPKSVEDPYSDDSIYDDDGYDNDDLYERRALKRRRGEDDVAQPKRDRPPVKPEHHRSAPRKLGGGTGRR